jgi:uncharacterized protein (DUF983 family)
MNSQLDHSLLIHPRPSLVTMVSRGFFKRCAWCGGKRAFFTGFYEKGERCNTCGLNWQRNLEGFELGAAAMGVFLTFGPIILWMVIALLASVNFVPLLIGAAVLAVIPPILTYPLTYTIWFGVHLFMNEPDEQEIQDALRWRESKSETPPF